LQGQTVVATKSEIEDAIERNYAPERLLGDILKNVSSMTI